MNVVRTAMLLAVMTALFMAVGYAVGGRGGNDDGAGLCRRHEPVFLVELRQDGAAHASRRRGG